MGPRDDRARAAQGRQHRAVGWRSGHSRSRATWQLAAPLDHLPLPGNYLSVAVAEVMGRIPEETAHFDFSRVRRVEPRQYSVAGNWKVYVDTYLEGYQIPVADGTGWRLSVTTRGSSPRSGRCGWRMRRGGCLQINIVVPLAPDRALNIFEWYHAEPGTPESWNTLQESITISERIQQENVDLCDDAQANLRTGNYDRGRFSVTRENGVHHFQRLYTVSLAR
jgi:ring hydroxylating enzyme alpha subunit